jgi:hypothetical protein
MTVGVSLDASNNTKAFSSYFLKFRINGRQLEDICNLHSRNGKRKNSRTGRSANAGRPGCAEKSKVGNRRLRDRGDVRLDNMAVSHRSNASKVVLKSEWRWIICVWSFVRQLPRLSCKASSGKMQRPPVSAIFRFSLGYNYIQNRP